MGSLLKIVLVLFCLFAVSPELAAAPEGAVVRARIDTAVTHVSADYIEDALARADAIGASALVLELDTPGGLLDATRRIVKAFLAAETPVLCHVGPAGARAGSAGVFIAMAAHVLAMAPATHLGAAHPVGMLGGDIEGEMKRKVENDTVAWARSLAIERGRNADWAEKAVRESATMTASEALGSGVIDVVASDVDEFLSRIEGRKVKVGEAERVLHLRGLPRENFEPSGRQRLGNFLADPNLAFILVIVGLLGIFIEFQSPGLVLPGAVGAVCLALVFGVQVLPVNWLGAVLLLAAAVLLVAEIYVTSFGILLFLAMLCMVSGAYLLFDVPAVAVSAPLIWSLALFVAAVALALGFVLLRVRRQGATSGLDTMRGDEGLVQEAVVPGQSGRVFLRGTSWLATSSQAIAAGRRVRVIRMEGARAVVEMVEEESNS